VAEPFISRGFRGRQVAPEIAARIPPGQHLEEGFPVLSAGPTPMVDLATWDLRVDGEVETPRTWTWDAFLRLPQESFTVDIHCVTKWSKLDTTWQGVSLDLLLEGRDPAARYLIAHCDGGYTTNLPIAEVTGGKAWIALTYDGLPLDPEHGGPARLLVPHRYFWKSAKWIRRLELAADDRPGFWEELGYHNEGDPWREQRYWGD
jgi:DMSO/TMAO reductase YedYZ molybdopterin-dependent catalytic subunit